MNYKVKLKIQKTYILAASVVVVGGAILAGVVDFRLVCKILYCRHKESRRVVFEVWHIGGKIGRMAYKLASKSVRELHTAAIDEHPQAVDKELMRLTKIGEIEKVRWGVYAVPKTFRAHNGSNKYQTEITAKNI